MSTQQSVSLFNTFLFSTHHLLIQFKMHKSIRVYFVVLGWIVLVVCPKARPMKAHPLPFPGCRAVGEEPSRSLGRAPLETHQKGHRQPSRGPPRVGIWEWKLFAEHAHAFFPLPP